MKAMLFSINLSYINEYSHGKNRNISAYNIKNDRKKLTQINIDGQKFFVNVQAVPEYHDVFFNLFLFFYILLWGGRGCVPGNPYSTLILF